MTIDIEELRRKVNSTDIVDHIDLHANIRPLLSELIDRLEAAEKGRDDVAQQLVQSEQGKRKIGEECAELLEKLASANRAVEEAYQRGYVIGQEEIEAERNALRAKIEQMEKPGAEWFGWLPQGTTHISSIRTVTIPCFGLEARFNAFKYIDGVLYTYRTDSDNEYGEWVKADSRYRNGVLPTVYPLSGAKGEEK